jgi:hypothetical protein
MKDEQIIKTSWATFYIIKENKEIDRENLKKGMKTLSDNEIHPVVLDFVKRGENIYSNGFNDVINFSISANIISEKRGSVIYFLTKEGKKYFAEMPQKHPDILTPEYIKSTSQIVEQILKELKRTK